MYTGRDDSSDRRRVRDSRSDIKKHLV